MSDKRVQDVAYFLLFTRSLLSFLKTHWFSCNGYSFLFSFLIKLITPSKQETLAGLVKNILVADCEDVKTSLLTDSITVGGGIGGGCIREISYFDTKINIFMFHKWRKLLVIAGIPGLIFRVCFPYWLTMHHFLSADSCFLRSLTTL